MQIVVYDFETYYDSKSYTLSKMSAVDYVRDPRFHALCMGFSVNGSQPSVVEYDDIPYALRLLDLENPETLLIGHNSAGFDNLILSEVYGVHPAFMTDTMHLSRWSGLSRVCREGLASLTAHLKVGQKRTGTIISDGLACKEQFMPVFWEDFKKYCAEDVINTGKILKLMMPFMTLDAIKFSSISCRMATEPCFIADADRLKTYLAELERKEADALATLKKTFNLLDEDSFLSEIRSARKFAAMLKLLGCDPPMKLSVKKTEANRKKILERGVIPPEQITDEMCAVYEPALAKTDLEFLDLLEHPDIRVRELVKIRLEHNSSIAKTRALNLLNMANYNRPFPILLKCYYAHTSRYGAGTSEGKSDGTNIQNLPKHNKQMEPLRQAIIVPKGYKVIACDSSQIEARCLAYAANFTELLNQFKEHRDPYAELAAKFGFGPTADEIHAGAKKGDPFLTKLRQAGKKGILSCVAGDTEVLTNHGWKPIVEVKVDDKVYDGEDFVEHKGLLPRGDKYTLCIDGVWITPDHLIYNGRSWCSARDCYNLSSALNLALLYGVQSVPIDISKQATEVHIDGRVQPVYDLVDCGDLNRFTIRSDSGALVIHNCGYGVGSSKYADSLWKEGVHLDEDKGTHNTIAKQAHDIYRQVSAPIVNFWGNCQKVIANLVGGLEGCWGGPNSSLFIFGKMPMPDGTEIPSIKLPSGFILRYPNLRLEQNDVGKPVYYYDRTLGKNIVATKIYGGSTCENVTQAFAFQILLWQACRMSEAGIKLACNIHDSFATVVKSSEAQHIADLMLQIMKTVPPWAEGLPIDAEVKIGDDFSIV